MLFWPLLSNESESNESCPVFSGKQKGAATNQRKVKQPSYLPSEPQQRGHNSTETH